MTPSEKLKSILRTLNLPGGDQYVVAGSGPMAMRDIREVNDVDIFCTTGLWFSLNADQRYRLWTTRADDPVRCCDPPYLIRHVDGVEVNIFFGFKDITPRHFAQFIGQAEDCDGFPVLPLATAYAWKRAIGRDKDLEDLRLIEEYRLTQKAARGTLA